MKWDNDKLENFTQNVTELSDLFQSLSLSLEQDDSETNINDNLSKFSESLYGCSYEIFGQTIRNPNISTQPKQNKWFNDSCRSDKTNFNRAKHAFTQNRSQQNRVNFVKSRSKFNKTKRRAKMQFKSHEGEKIADMAKSNPRGFWKKLKQYSKSSKPCSENLSANEFFQHFSEVLGGEQNINDRNLNLNFQLQSNTILDTEILQGEVRSAIKSLASNKSPGLDGLIPEIFKASEPIITPFITKLFNTVFRSNVYPRAWTESFITPIFKKGDTNDTNNYRGVTLIKIIAKLYSKILHDRLIKWASENDKITSNQYGFQKNKSTIDCIFIFHSLISKLLNNNEKLYCSFVDYQKAFDTVDRNLMWYKLLRDGCSTSMVKALKAMYESVRMCVKHKNSYSDFFISNSGVKQGDPLSPILFIFFINDLVTDLSTEDENSIKINDLNIFMLLFADDAVLFSKSHQSLQLMLNKLKEYSSYWKLNVNTQKTKIMIFEKGRTTNLRFYYDNQELEIVHSFKYLGVTFYKNGHWFRTQKCIAEYGTYALHNLYKTLSNIELPISEQFRLFDSLVGSVLSYAAEVWGYHKADDIERVHTRFCRSKLGVKRSTNVAALYMELGRFQLTVFRQIRMLTYWSKLVKSDDPLLRATYSMLRDDVNQGNTYNNQNWAYHIKSLLDQLGFGYVWREQDQLLGIPLTQIRQRLFDQASQCIITSVNDSHKLTLYRRYKKDIKSEHYLSSIRDAKYKIALNKFRLSSHSLLIETGRYTGIPTEERLCNFCNMRKIEDEFHFLLVCPHYIELRRKYLKRYVCTWPTLNKFDQLLSTSSKKTLTNLSKYIYYAFKKRNTA